MGSINEKALRNLIKMFGYYTGSTVYGPFNEGSDTDFVVIRGYDKIFLAFLAVRGIAVEVMQDVDYDDPCSYFTINGRAFNMIVVRNINEYKEWVYATQQMLKIAPIEDRNERLEVFHKYKNSKRWPCKG